jgi:hypothetical protein
MYDSANPDALFEELSKSNLWSNWYNLKDQSHRTEVYNRENIGYEPKIDAALYCQGQVKKLQATIAERNDIVLEIILWPNNAPGRDHRAFLPVARSHSHGFHKGITDENGKRLADAKKLLSDLEKKFGHH